MGAWGPGPFDNDDATDWYLALVKTKDLSLVEEVLDASIVDDELFYLGDMDTIAAACEVVLGLLNPQEFERLHKSGPEHVDPFAHGLEEVSNFQKKSEPAMPFAIPAELVAWVNRHGLGAHRRPAGLMSFFAPRRLDASALLLSADTILTGARERGEKFYDGYFRDQSVKERWLRYIEDLHDRIKVAHSHVAR
jgi:Domain of unknown function (DUF4259)